MENKSNAELAPDPWIAAAAKAIFTRMAHFEAPPGDLTGIKRMPANGAQAAGLGFWSRKLKRPVYCESGAELSIFW